MENQSEKSEDVFKQEFLRILEQKRIPFIDFSNLKISKKDILGVGGFRKVYKGFFYHYSVAIKEYNINLFELEDDDPWISTLNEISNSMSLNFPGLNRCYGVSLNDHGGLFTVHDLAVTSLDKKLKEGSLTLQEKFHITEQILQIMQVLQKRKVIHCNLKPSKFLLTTLGEVQISDGFIMRINDEISDKAVINLKYSPSEFIMAEDEEMCGFGLFSDVWSLGIILFEIYYGQPFWGKMTKDIVIDTIKNDSVPQAQVKIEVPPEITIIVNRALVIDGEKRIKLEEMVELFEKAKKN